MLRVLSELEIVMVADAGIANKERIIIKVHDYVDLSNYVLIVGMPVGDHQILPLRDHFFWFGKEVVGPQYTIFLYTGPGTRLATTVQGTNEPALVLYWGKPTTLFHSRILSPAILSLEGIFVGPQPQYSEARAISGSR